MCLLLLLFDAVVIVMCLFKTLVYTIFHLFAVLGMFLLFASTLFVVLAIVWMYCIKKTTLISCTFHNRSKLIQFKPDLLCQRPHSDIWVGRLGWLVATMSTLSNNQSSLLLPSYHEILFILLHCLVLAVSCLAYFVTIGCIKGKIVAVVHIITVAVRYM